MPLSSIFCSVLVFASLGPGIGALVVIVGTSLHTFLIEATPVRLHWIEVATVTAWAYVFAIVPAALTGLSWSIVVRRLNPARLTSQLFRASIGLLLGAVIAAIAGLVWSIDGSWRELTLLMSGAGAVSGSLLASVFPRTRRLRDLDRRVAKDN
jgi:hypothetical protein